MLAGGQAALRAVPAPALLSAATRGCHAPVPDACSAMLPLVWLQPAFSRARWADASSGTVPVGSLPRMLGCVLLGAHRQPSPAGDEGGPRNSEQAAKSYANHAYEQPYSTAVYTAGVLLEARRWHVAEYEAVVGALSADDLTVLAAGSSPWRAQMHAFNLGLRSVRLADFANGCSGVLSAHGCRVRRSCSWHGTRRVDLALRLGRRCVRSSAGRGRRRSCRGCWRAARWRRTRPATWTRGRPPSWRRAWRSCWRVTPSQAKHRVRT